ncbi:Lcl domain-containing protein [Massilia niastensis]|uniref:Lcl domain-containing protein n=1 Tax=Massilia niastensis TaxID=544911 RepID=UPI00146B3DFC|nr:DUF1566 domain-containing protein [Massilia niastensis]
MIYDDATNLTWLQDVNYARTIGLQGELLRDEWGRTQPSVDQNGHLTWNEAMRFAEGLTYGGYDDWRLPRQGTGPAVHEDRHSELAVMFYYSLGNQGAYIDGVYNRAPYGLLNKSPFLFGNTTIFWTGDIDRNGYTSIFDMNHGFSGATDRNSIFNHFGAWLVRDGDVATSVPEPSAFSLLLLGVAGLLTQKLKRKQR